MFEDYEGISNARGLNGILDTRTIDERNFLTQNESSYIKEVLPYNNSELLVSRIDEMCSSIPPKAIDSNKEVAELIEPIKDNISPEYLEAPSDNVQITEYVNVMNNIDGLKYCDWVSSGYEQKIEILQELENSVARIAHRPSCRINVKDLGIGNYGNFDLNTKEITVNSHYIKSDNFVDYKETLDTIVHEGRHAYQDYNINERLVHPRGTEVENWRLNSDSQLGYLDAQTWGFELYEYQPLEADAKAFAGDVINQFLKNA